MIGLSQLEIGRLEEAFQLPDAGGVPHLAQSLRFDLPNALAGDLELAADFFERPAVAIDQAEPLLQDLALALRERGQHVANLVLEERDRRDVRRVLGGLIGNEITEALVV